jgi:ABC-type nickel/cobalt efflux system permease component RcnA
MKSIALLTMVILPGTFISTLFAIPLFNWDAETWREVPKSRFWFYWALTIPLTILTVAAWLVWQKIYERTGRSLDKAAREEVSNTKILDDQTHGASSSTSDHHWTEEHNVSDGLRQRNKDRLAGWLPCHRRSNQSAETNQVEPPV